MFNKYRVLKNTPHFKAGSVIHPFTIKFDRERVGDFFPEQLKVYCLISESVSLINFLSYPREQEVENNPEWYQLIPENITCLVVGDAMRFDNGTFMTATLTLSSPIPNEKMGDIRKAIEEVVNDKKQ